MVFISSHVLNERDNSAPHLQYAQTSSVAQEWTCLCTQNGNEKELEYEGIDRSNNESGCEGIGARTNSIVKELEQG
ncbi:hypothetical protein Pyn_07305 [Prunus yedoensis var. nudiflora]|uniref:Uncharacterized protein n=1 Tax=Prunus yedoensis var. nudiflora TaxID=2094558 RepID=A0A314XNY1_PRUYE|nr:hypothetical protein Pyn_07305 [Prunus yedoensis var. nudiflora]